MRKTKVTPEIRRYETLEQMSAAAAAQVRSLATAAILERGRFSLVLSGGVTPRPLYELLGRPAAPDPVDWQKCYIFWGDERCLPLDHAGSNFRLARESFVSRVAIPEKNIFRMPGEEAPHAGAAAYEERLRSFFGVLSQEGAALTTFPIFDLIILGLGSDGHTASLFPDSEALHEEKRWIVPVAAPATAPQVARLTMTLPVLNRARNVWFLIAGQQKMEVAQQVMIQAENLEPPVLPAARVKPEGRLVWFFALKTEG